MHSTEKKLNSKLIALVSLITVFVLGLQYNAKYISEHSSDIYRHLTLSREERILWNGDAVGQDRKTLIARACAASRNDFNVTQLYWDIWSDEKRPRLFYSQEKQILLCGTPKSGSTQWINMLLILDGLVNATTADELLKITNESFHIAMKYRFFWRTINITTVRGRNRANDMLNNYYKIMTVREPLKRLVSAYMSKLEKDGNKIFAPLSRKIHQRFSKHPIESGLATFSEFVDFVLSVKNPAKLNVHWMPYWDICDPCRMKYDYIAKIETIYDDTDYITTKLGIDRRILFDESKGEDLRKKWDTKYFKYYEQLTPLKRIAIFEYYKPQYDMFGYTYPEFITKLLEEHEKNRTVS